MLFPLVQLFVAPGVRILEVLHQLWLLYVRFHIFRSCPCLHVGTNLRHFLIYLLLHFSSLPQYYTALGIRENILQVNGSDIQTWWIVHHYVSMLIAVVCLLWPPSSTSYRLFLPQLLSFLALQGLIMMLQNNYQKARHYVRRSLGKAQDIDVASSETIREKPTNLKLLVPALALTYLAEIYLGATAILHAARGWTALSGTGEPVCLLLLGCLFAVLGFGNAATTFWVLYRKSRKQNQLLKRRSSMSSAASH